MLGKYLYSESPFRGKRMTSKNNSEDITENFKLVY